MTRVMYLSICMMNSFAFRKTFQIIKNFSNTLSSKYSQEYHGLELLNI